MEVTANKPALSRAQNPASRAARLAAWAALACALPAQALDWRFTPSVGASATYTDNVNQSASDPRDALILGITPDFSLQSEGSRRVQATLQYGLTGVSRFGEDESTDLYHRLNAAGKAELVEDFLFVDGSARISQELISLLGSPAEADINASNRASVGTYSISPYIQKRLGTFANAQARYTASGAIFEDDVATASNSTVNAFAAALTSGTRFNDLSWGLNYSIRKADNRNAADTTFERAVLDLGYALTRKFRVLGSVGEEWNDYPSATETETSGSSYSVGFGFAPSRRTNIEASAGERYFGNTYSLSARHRTRSANWSASYVEDVSDITQLLVTSGTLYNYLCPDAEGNLQPVLDWPFSTLPAPNCIAFGTPGRVFDLRNGVFISKTLRAGVNWQIRRMSYSVNVSDSKRLYTAANAEDQTQTVGAAATYKMAPHTTVNGSLNLTRTTVPEPLSVPAYEDDLLSLSLGVSHRFAGKLNGALTFRYSQRDSNAATSDYEENSIMASVNLRL